MARTITLDVDKLIAGANIIGEDGPGLLGVLSAIFPGIGKAAQYAPALPHLAKMAGRFASINTEDGGLRANIDTGPLGKGRKNYIRRRSSYTDADVVSAAEEATSIGNNACNRIVETINLSLRLMFPETEEGTWSAKQERMSIDKILMDDEMSEGIWDRFGDIVNFVLKNKKPAEAIEAKATEQPKGE